MKKASPKKAALDPFRKPLPPALQEFVRGQDDKPTNPQPRKHASDGVGKVQQAFYVTPERKLELERYCVNARKTLTEALNEAMDLLLAKPPLGKTG